MTMKLARCFAPLITLVTLGWFAACVGPAGPAGPQGEPGEPLEPAKPLLYEGAALDAHTHLMSPALTEAIGGPGLPAPDADDLIAHLDEGNVERAVVLSLAYFPELDDDGARAENDFTAAEVAKYPERLIGFCGIDPLRDMALSEIDRCVDELGMTGLKIHLPASGVDVEVEEQVAALAAVFDRAAERELPVLMHAGSPLGLPLDADGLANVATIIASHPTVPLTFAHCTNDADRSEIDVWIEGMAQGLFNVDNMYVDTSSCLEHFKDAPDSVKEHMVWRLREWGIERVLYASDYMRLSYPETPAEALETISSFPFTQEELDIILTNDGSAWLGR